MSISKEKVRLQVTVSRDVENVLKMYGEKYGINATKIASMVLTKYAKDNNENVCILDDVE